MRYQTLYQIAKNLHRDQTITDETLQQLLAQVSKALDVKHGCMITFRNNGELDRIFVLGAEDAPEMHDRSKWQVLFDKGLLGFAYYSDRTVVIRNIQADPRRATLADAIYLPKTGSAVGIPLERDGVVNAVMIYMHPDVDYFDDDTLEFLYEVEEIASNALANIFTAQKNAENSYDTRYEAIFEHTPVPVVLTDDNGLIIDANLKACKFLGFSRNVLRSIPLSDVNIVPTTDFSEIGSEEQHFPTNTYDIDGNQIPTLIRARRVQFDGNEYIEWVLQDMSVQFELEQLRKDLTAMVYHDLRGPMGSIKMAITKLQQLLADYDNDAVQKILGLGLRSTEQVARLVEALLDIQRLEGGSSILDKQETEIHEMLADAFQLVQPIADHAGINVQIDISHVPTVEIDSDMLKRVVINLMENAVKYTPTGSSVTLRSEDAGDRIRIIVSDTGPGIPPEMLDSIFNKFSRVKYQNVPKGLGLGLAFCRLAVEAHGGKVWVESDGKNGSDFIFTIPLDFVRDENLPDTSELAAPDEDDKSDKADNQQVATTV